MGENVLNEFEIKSLYSLSAELFAVSIFFMVAILKFKMAAIILDESRVFSNFLKSTDLLGNCVKFHTFITLLTINPLSSGLKSFKYMPSLLTHKTMTPFISLGEQKLKDINRLFAYCKGGNFNIHIWAWFGYFIS